MDFSQSWKQYALETEHELERYLSDSAIPSELSAAMRYSVFAGGKRLRPVLLLASCELFDGDRKNALPLACAMEMIHTYSLIHDDLPAMDDDDFRRGRSTCHKVYGEAMAILAGDALLTYAFEMALAGAFRPGVDAVAYVRAVRCIADAAGARGMVAGQVLDLQNEGNANLSAVQLDGIHRCKTGALITASLLAGALVNSPTVKQVEAVEQFGHNLGIAFQIEDDILDVVGTADKMGKTPGKDEKSDKSTYVRLYGLEASREKAAAYTDQALQALAPFGERGEFLAELAVDMLRRDH